MNCKIEPHYLCLHVPEFSAQARLRHRPTLRTRAVAILDGIAPLQTVCSATRRAREMGVARGMTRAELESFPAVESLLRSEPEERSAASALLSVLWGFSPRVQVLPSYRGSHRLVMDIAGTERLFGSCPRLADMVQQETAALGFVTHAAASANFHAAVCLAPYARAKPHMVARGGEAVALAPLPLVALNPLTDEQHEMFALWGLRTLGELAALPEAQLIARMGQAGKEAWLMARGQGAHLMQPEEEHFTLGERASFDTPVEMLDSLLFVLGPMLDQLIRRAEGRALALASVTLRLQLTNHAAEDEAAPQDACKYARTVKPALPMADSRVLLKLLHLELQAHPPGAPVASIELSAEPGDRARAQLGLFSPQLPEPSRLEVTLARLRALVGEGRVGRPHLQDTHRPQSFTVEPFLSPVQMGQSSVTKKQSSSGGNDRCAFALRRLRPPAPLSMRVEQGNPRLFFWRGVRHEVVAAYGPWRQSGDWWTGAAWSHEEWDVTVSRTDGIMLACRVARDLLHPHWTLEGLYD